MVSQTTLLHRLSRLTELPAQDPPTAVDLIDPPAQDFYSKQVHFWGIPIRAHAVVADEALIAAWGHMQMMMRHLPAVLARLHLAGSEFHIIGKNQRTVELPPYKHLEMKSSDGKVVDLPRGLGGLVASCAEENLLGLPQDPYRGWNIFAHEFAHNIQNHGLGAIIGKRIREQYERSLSKGLWRGLYTATNDGEFFADLSVWYFRSDTDDLSLPPAFNCGRNGFQRYDPEAFALLDDIYSGRLTVPWPQCIELAPHAPELESTLFSPSNGEAAVFNLFNETNHAVNLYWLNHLGQRYFCGEVQPQARFGLPTYVGDAWVVTAAGDDRSIAAFVACAGDGIATVKAI